MGATVGTLAINIVARHQSFTKGMAQVRKQLSLGEVAAKSFIKVFGGIGAALALRNAAQSSREFNQAMRSSLAIMGDVSEAMQNEMANAARKVAFETKFAANEAAEAYFFLASAGLTAQQSIAALPQVARFAQAGMFDLARATDLLTDAQSALGLTVPDAQQNLENLIRVSDVLVKANTLANASVEQFSEALTNKAGAALRLVGKDIEEGVAVLAAFADQGVKGAEAGTALSIVFRDLQTKALQNANAFRRAGVEVFDAAGDMRNMAAIVRDLEGMLTGLSDAQKKESLLDLGFSDKSIQFLQTLIGTSDKIREYETALREASGITQEVAEKQLPPFEKGLNQVAASFSLLADVLLGPVLTALGKAMTFLIDALRGLKGGAVQAGVQLALFAATLTAALLIIPKIVAAIKTVVTALRTMASAQAIVQALSGPKGWGVLLGSVLAAASATALVSNAFADLEIEISQTTDEANAFARAHEDIMKAFADIAAGMRETTEQASTFNATLSRAKQITDSLRTPTELFADSLNELRDLFNLNAISAETYARGVAKAKQELLDATKAQEGFESVRNTRVAAVVRGTTAEFSATRESARAQLEDKRIQQKQLDEQRRIKEVLEQGFREVRQRRDMIEFNEVNLD
ncbi:MAG: phage tail tape measure protein [Pirellulales bacterium]|nr:phage tail tape measure protein [Pirellulales bacterium]